MFDRDISQLAESGGAEASSGGSEESVFTLFWRYKWLIICLTMLGVGFGYWSYQQKPTTYKALAKLMFRSNQPLVLNSQTGAMEGPIPNGSVMQSLLVSDAIMKRISEDPVIRELPNTQGKSRAEIEGLLRGGLRFQAVTSAIGTDRMIASLSFDGGDPALCVAAVDVASIAMSEHFAAERESQIDGLTNVIGEANGTLQPKFEKLEKEYRDFQESSLLKWDKDGNLINPYRERQLRLEENRDELERDAKRLARELKTANLIIGQNDDPIMVARMIGRFSDLGDVYSDPRLARETVGGGQDDIEIEKIRVEGLLVPLEIERAELQSQFGENHPQVASITRKIEENRTRLVELEQMRINRRAKLLEKSEKDGEANLHQKTLQKKALDYIAAFTGSLEHKLKVLAEDIEDLDRQIDVEEGAADKLHMAENEDRSYKRRMDMLKGMLDELEQKLAELDLVTTTGGIVVQPLLGTSNAFVTGPDLKKDLIMFGMLGLALSAGIAMLWEVLAKMFRSAEEIQRELRLPVLAHVPMDEGRVQRGKTAADQQVAKLDPKLSVVHRPYSASAEAIRGIRTALLFDRRSYDSKVFQVTSPLPADGKSTVAANLGCSLAQSGKRVLLIDLDLRSPRMSLRFNLQQNVGLTNVLNGEVAPVEAVHDTPIEKLDILPCGPLPANPAEALTIPELGDVFKWARANYDFVIVDTPPLLMVSDPAVVTAYVDAAMLVMRIRRRCKPNSKESVAMLRSAGVRVVGVVVNRLDEVSGGASYKASASGSYQTIGYGYGDKYRRRYQKEANMTDSYIVRGKDHALEDDMAPSNLLDGTVDASSADEPLQSGY